jgi:hypothetical protein
MNRPDRDNFGYYPMYVQYDLLKYECPNIPNSVRAFHIPFNFDHNSILKLSLVTNFDLAVMRMDIHYLHRSQKILKSVNLEYDYDMERREFTINMRESPVL